MKPEDKRMFRIIAILLILQILVAASKAGWFDNFTKRNEGRGVQYHTVTQYATKLVR